MGKHQSKLTRSQSDASTVTLQSSVSTCSVCSSTVSVSSVNNVDNIDSIVNVPLSESEKSHLASLPNLKFESLRRKKSKKCNHKISSNHYHVFDPSLTSGSDTLHQQTQTQKIQNQVSPILPSTDFNINNYITNRKHPKNNSNYLFPMDDRECDRLQFQFYIYKHVWENNFSAPVHEILSQEGSKVLDVGCGPGYWTLETSVDYPLAHFTGIDTTKTFPSTVKPQNVEFLQANIVKGLPFSDNTFDFVMIRLMIFSFTVDEWEKAVREAVRVCKVGGWVEMMEKDILFFGAGKIANEAQRWFANEIRKKKKIEVIITPHLPRYLSMTNKITNIHHAERNVPFGEHAGSLGKNYSEIYAWGAKNLKKVVKNIGGYRGDIGGNGDAGDTLGESIWTRSSSTKRSKRRLGFGGNDKEWDDVVDRCVEELNVYRAYDKIHRVWGMKTDESMSSATGPGAVSRSAKDGEAIGVINGITVIEVL